MYITEKREEKIEDELVSILSHFRTENILRVVIMTRRASASQVERGR